MSPSSKVFAFNISRCMFDISMSSLFWKKALSPRASLVLMLFLDRPPMSILRLTYFLICESSYSDKLTDFYCFVLFWSRVCWSLTKVSLLESRLIQYILLSLLCFIQNKIQYPNLNIVIFLLIFPLLINFSSYLLHCFFNIHFQ